MSLSLVSEKKLSRNSAVKVLNHAMTGVEGQDNCQKFVEILGLRSVFPLYMKTPKAAKTGPTSDELEGKSRLWLDWMTSARCYKLLFCGCDQSFWFSCL